MQRLIICAFAVVSLNSFGAAGPELAQLSKEAAKSDALSRLITVTQGASKTPFSLAYRSIGTKSVYVCLVASSKLNESISPNVAQTFVDAFARDAKSYFLRHLACMNIVYKNIIEKVVSREILSDALIAFFVLRQARYGELIVEINSFGPKKMLGRLYGAQDKDLVAGCSVIEGKTVDGCWEGTSKCVKQSVGIGFKEYDLDVEFNYDTSMKYFPRPEANCSIL